MTTTTTEGEIVRFAADARPCLYCQAPTYRRSVIAFHGDGEMAAHSIERPECDYCSTLLADDSGFSEPEWIEDFAAEVIDRQIDDWMLR